ncbi:MAG: hypothetical protein DSZ05_09060 [Sulfurospirillum sp.]|nr:MAG: hypothetical protein DSZ05_09060 [Sulfurospirillum sp.]
MRNSILTITFSILVSLSTAYAWKVDYDGTTQMKLTDTGRLWIGADGKYGKPKMAVTTTENDEDRALDVRAEKATDRDNFGVVATASGNGAPKNIALYGWASEGDKNYGLYVDSGYGYFADKVGIGTDTPTANLVVSDTSPSVTIEATDSSGNAYLKFIEGENGTNGIQFDYDSDNNKLWIKNNSDDAIIASFRRSGSELFRVNGEMRATAYNTDSDKRLKKDINPIENPLDKVSQLRGITYRWKDTNKSQHIQMGFIAQEVEKVVPEIVSKPDSADEFYSMDYSKLTALLVESIKELKKQNNALKELVCQDHPDADICTDTKK